MKKIAYAEMKAAFYQHERNSPTKHLAGYIVFTEDSFAERYSLEARTYRVSSDSKAFNPYNAGYSIVASAVDGSDSHVRLDWYMAEEGGGLQGWKVDYCYLECANGEQDGAVQAQML